MAFVFEDEAPAGQFVFEDEAPAPQPKAVTMEQARGRSLPATWDVEIGGQPFRGVFDADANAYLVSDRMGQAYYINKDAGTGALGLKPYKGKASAAGTTAENFWAGAGKAAVDTKRGIQQLTKLAGNTLGLVSDEAVDQSFADAKDVSARDADLMDTGAGKAGNFAGNVAAMYVGGGLVRWAGQGVGQVGKALATRAPTLGTATSVAGNTLSNAGRAISAPTNFKQAAASGAAIGAVQPAESMAEKAAQVGMGAGIGGAAAVVLPPALRGLSQGVMGIVNSVNRRFAPAEAQEIGATLELSLRNAGFDPGNMSREVQQRLVEYINSGATDLSPQALARIANAESLAFPVKLTKGAITRDFKQQQAESMLSRMDAGEDLRALNDANNAAIIKNMGKLAADQRPTAATPYQIGQSVRKAAQGAEDASWEQVGQAYDKARATGKQVMIDPAPIVDQINKNIDAINAGNDSGPIMQMVSALERFGVIKKGADGLYQPTGNQMMGEQIMQLYQAANQSFKPGTTSAIHIGDVKKGILSALDTVGDAGPEYQAAINSMKRHVREFDDPKAVSQLLKMSSDSDPMIAAERIFDRAFVKASIDDVANLNRMMLRSDKSVRRDATTAVRNMRAGLVKYLLDESFAGQTTNAVNDRVVSGANMVAAIEKLGGGDLATGWQKIDALMGKKHTAELKKIVGASFDATNKIKEAAQSSGTAERVLNALGKLPFLGGATELAVRFSIDGVRKQLQRKAAQSATKGIELLGEPAAAREQAQQAAIGRAVSSSLAGSFPALYQAATE